MTSASSKPKLQMVERDKVLDFRAKLFADIGNSLTVKPKRDVLRENGVKWR